MRSLAGRQRALIVLATLLGTWLIGSVYAFASPVGTSPDEAAHWRYAYAVLTGQDTSDGWLEVPASLAGWPSTCIVGRPDLNAACVPIVTEDRDMVSDSTPLYGAPVLYYQLVGWPLTQWPDERGILLSRVLSSLVSALLWAIAILPWTGRRQWPVRLAVILTAAPAALYFSGTIQSSGMEIAAFAATWSLSVVVFGHLRSGGYRSLPMWIQVAWPLFVMTSVFIRFASAWFVAIVLLVAWLWSAVPLRRLLRDRRVIAAGAVVVSAAALRSVSFLADRGAGIYGVNDPPGQDLSVTSLLVSLATRIIDEPDRAIGLMGWVDTQVPSMGTMYWFLMAGGIAFLAAPFVRRRDLVSIGVLFGILGATVLVLDISVYAVTGNPLWQPRYGFPIWMGVPIMLAATYVVGTATQPVAIVPVLRWACAAGLAIMHVVAVGFLMVRYMYGVWFGGIGALGWTPYAQTMVVAGAAIIGALALALPVLLPGCRSDDDTTHESAVPLPEPAGT